MNCATLHVADNDDFLLQKQELPKAPSRLLGTCDRCQKVDQLLRCPRCGRYHCAGGAR